MMAERKRKVTDSNTANRVDEPDEITMETRELPPVHYVFKIESFSQFSKNDITIHETNEFEVGDQKWRLIIYPKGDKSKKGENHVSLYLTVSQSDPLRIGQEIYATIRFFVFDQIRDEYLVKEGKNMKFHAMKSKWGIPKFMSLKIFTDPANGYLVDDTCVFGAEVFVIKSWGIGECLTLEKSSTTYTHKWNISRLSSLGDESFSDEFTFGNHKWKVWLYPRGDLSYRGQSLSVFLILVDADKLTSPQKVNTRFTFRLKGQNNVVHRSLQASAWLSSSVKSWGFPSYMPLKTVRECLVDDSCVIEAEVTVLATVTKLP